MIRDIDRNNAQKMPESDETIKMTFADYTARRDPVFERAVALAAN